MSIPAQLNLGQVSIYGASSTQGIVLAGDSKYGFGVIDQLYVGAQNYIVGQSVMFPVSEANPIRYLGVPYFIVDESKIILTENSGEA